MNKFAVISGGTKGIGRALVEKFAEKGFDVATCSRTASDLGELSEHIVLKFPEIELFTMKADLSEVQDRTDLLILFRGLTARSMY